MCVWADPQWAQEVRGCDAEALVNLHFLLRWVFSPVK